MKIKTINGTEESYDIAHMIGSKDVYAITENSNILTYTGSTNTYINNSVEQMIFKFPNSDGDLSFKWSNEIHDCQLKNTDTFGDNSLVAKYLFDSNTTELVSGNDGTPFGTNYIDSDKGGSAISFSGSTTSYMSIPSNVTQTFDGMNQWTMSMWIKLNDINTWNAIIAGSTDFTRPSLIIRDKHMGYYASSNSTNWNVLSSGSNGIGTHTLVPDVWHHVVYMRDAIGYKGYINGVLDLSINSTVALLTMDAEMWLGKWGNNLSTHVGRHKVDRFEIYNRGLTQEEINTLYNM